MKTFLAIVWMIAFNSLCVHGYQEVNRKRECNFAKYKPIRLSETTPVRKRVEPQYPPVPQEVRIEGSVVVQVLIDAKGNVFAACAISGHPLLRESAVKAALQWKFEPNCKGCLLRKGRYLVELITFNFKIH
jgi:TonB family protein